jgi:hypothetical protein
MLCRDDADTKTTFTIATRNELPTKEKKLGSSAEVHGWCEVMFLTTPAEGQPRVALLADISHIEHDGIEARKNAVRTEEFTVMRVQWRVDVGVGGQPLQYWS